MIQSPTIVNKLRQRKVRGKLFKLAIQADPKIVETVLFAVESHKSSGNLENPEPENWRDKFRNKWRGCKSSAREKIVRLKKALQSKEGKKILQSVIIGVACGYFVWMSIHLALLLFQEMERVRLEKLEQERLNATVIGKIKLFFNSLTQKHLIIGLISALATLATLALLQKVYEQGYGQGYDNGLGDSIKKLTAQEIKVLYDQHYEKLALEAKESWAQVFATILIPLKIVKVSLQKVDSAGFLTSLIHLVAHYIVFGTKIILG